MTAQTPFKISVEHWDEKITIEKDRSDITFEEYIEMLRTLTRGVGFTQSQIDEAFGSQRAKDNTPDIRDLIRTIRMVYTRRMANIKRTIEMREQKIKCRCNLTHGCTNCRPNDQYEISMDI